ncbi:MAG: NHL repeat-containing protein [Chthoniobacter sp.]|nr:NHL repeat-containing protein [Chthoniobacter sp.]
MALVSQACQAGGLAFDADGNLFLAAAGSVLKFAPDGTKTTFATGLTNATSLTFDQKGNLFVVDTGSKTAYRFAPDGTKTPIMTEIGSYGLAFDGAGNLFIGQGHSIFKFTPDGTKSTFAAGLGNAMDLAVDAAGNLYVLDSEAKIGQSVYKFAPAGTKSDFLTLLHINPPGGLAVDSTGAVYLTQMKSGDASQSIIRFSPDGKRSVFAAAVPKADSLGSIAVDKAGNAFVFNGDTMYAYGLRKYGASGARTTSISPDGRWEYRIAGEQFPEIAHVGAREVAVDLSKDRDAPYPQDDAVKWSADSKSFAFHYSPPHVPHTSYDTVVIYQLRGDQWVATSPLVDVATEASQVAQLGQGRLPKKLVHDKAGERDILKLRQWIDADTAVLYGYTAHYGHKAGNLAAAYIFTVKFDDQGKWKIVEMHPASTKEKDEP